MGGPGRRTLPFPERGDGLFGVVAMTDEALIGVILSGIALEGAAMSGVVLGVIALDGAALDGVDLEGVGLDGFGLEGVGLDGVALDGVAVDGVGFGGVGLAAGIGGAGRVGGGRKGEIFGVTATFGASVLDGVGRVSLRVNVSIWGCRSSRWASCDGWSSGDVSGASTADKWVGSGG